MNLAILYQNVSAAVTICDYSFKDLSSKIITAFPELLHKKFQLHYIDSGDNIDVSTDADLKVMLSDDLPKYEIFVTVKEINQEALASSTPIYGEFKNKTPGNSHENMNSSKLKSALKQSKFKQAHFKIRDISDDEFSSVEDSIILNLAKKICEKSALPEEIEEFINCVMEKPLALCNKQQERLLILTAKNEAIGLDFYEEKELIQLKNVHHGEINPEKTKNNLREKFETNGIQEEVSMKKSKNGSKKTIKALKNFTQQKLRQKDKDCLDEIIVKNPLAFQADSKMRNELLSYKLQFYGLTSSEELELALLTSGMVYMSQNSLSSQEANTKTQTLGNVPHNSNKVEEVKLNETNLTQSNLVEKNIKCNNCISSPAIDQQFLKSENNFYCSTCCKKIHFQNNEDSLNANNTTNIINNNNQTYEEAKENIQKKTEQDIQGANSLSRNFVDIDVTQYNIEIIKEINTFPEKLTQSYRYIFKTILIKNIGLVPWDTNCVAAAVENHIKISKMQLPLLNPGEEGVITIVIPNTECENFEITLSFFVIEVQFGQQMTFTLQNLPQ